MAFNGAYLNVTGNVFFDASGSTASTIEATNVTADTVTANVVSAQNINYSNLEVSGNLAVQDQLVLGETLFQNVRIDNAYRAAVLEDNDRYAWKASEDGPEEAYTYYGTPYGTVLNLQFDASGIVPMVPQVTHYANFNGDEYFSSAGKIQSGSEMVADLNTTYYNWFSMTKSVTALLYARMLTLDVFELGSFNKVSDYFPVLNDVQFLVPKYEDAPTTDPSGVNVIDPSTGNPYRVPFDTFSRELKLAGKYVNVYPQTRELYLEDALNESVNFYGGFNQLYFSKDAGNALQSLMYNFDAVIADTSNFGLDRTQATAMTFQPARSLLLTGPDTKKSPSQFINDFFGAYSGKKYVQLSDHGNYNYNSSECIATACITEAYNRKFGTSFDYYEILRKELLDPVGASNMTYYFTDSSDTRLYNISSTFAINAVNSYYNFDASGYTLAFSLDSGTKHYTGISIQLNALTGGVFPKRYPLQWTYFQEPNASDVSGNVGRMYVGNLGLLSSVKDMARVLQLHQYSGCYLDLSGNWQRLINCEDVRGLWIPRVIQDETLYSNPGIVFGLGSAAVTFGYGGCSVGGPYTGAYAASVNLNINSAPQTQYFGDGKFEYNDLVPRVLPAVFNTHFVHRWSGAGGTSFYVLPDTAQLFITISNDAFGVYGYESINVTTHTPANYISRPDLNIRAQGRLA
jgi:hypothetical protein